MSVADEHAQQFLFVTVLPVSYAGWAKCPCLVADSVDHCVVWCPLDNVPSCEHACALSSHLFFIFQIIVSCAFHTFSTISTVPGFIELQPAPGFRTYKHVHMCAHKLLVACLVLFCFVLFCFVLLCGVVLCCVVLWWCVVVVVLVVVLVGGVGW